MSYKYLNFIFVIIDIDMDLKAKLVKNLKMRFFGDTLYNYLNKIFHYFLNELCYRAALSPQTKAESEERDCYSQHPDVPAISVIL